MMRLESALSPSWPGQGSTSLLGESRRLRNIVFRGRRRVAQRSFPRRPVPRTGVPADTAVRVRTAGAGGEKTARPKWTSGPLRRGLASDLPPDPQPHGGRDMGTVHWRFATGKPSNDRHRQVRRSAQPASASPPAIQPRPRGTGCRQGVVMRDAIQPPRLVGEGLGEAMPSPISMRVASKGSAIGWGFAPKRSHANLGTAGEEFA